MKKITYFLICAFLTTSYIATSCKKKEKKNKDMATIEREKIKKRAYTEREKWEARERAKKGLPPKKKRKSPF